MFETDKGAYLLLYMTGGMLMFLKIKSSLFLQQREKDLEEIRVSDSRLVGYVASLKIHTQDKLQISVLKELKVKDPIGHVRLILHKLNVKA